MDPLGSMGATPNTVGGSGLSAGRSIASSSTAATITSTSAQSTQAVTFQANVTQIHQVYSQVDAFLGTLGGSLQNNQLLRMIIALLILELLQDQDGQQGRGGGAGALSQLTADRPSSHEVLIHASRSVFQADYRSTTITGSQSVQASPGTASDGQPGGTIDLRA